MNQLKAAAIGLFLTLTLALLTCAHAQVTEPQLIIQQGHADPVNSVAFSPDSRVLASGSWDGAIKLWDVASGAELRSLAAAPMTLSVAFSPNGNILATAGTNEISLWDVTTGKKLRTLSANFVYSIAFSPDGKILASENSGDGTISLWDVKDGQVLRTIKNPKEAWSFVAFSPDGKFLASGSEGNTITLWDVDSGSMVRKLKRNSALGKSSMVIPVGFSPDGKTLASADPEAGITLWNATTGAEIRTIRSAPAVIWSLAFSPDNKTIAAASEAGDETGPKISPTILWDTTTGSEIRSLTGPSLGNLSVAFSQNNKLVASGSRDGKLTIWDAGTGKVIHELKPYSSWVTAVAFRTDDGSIITKNGDMIKVWDVNKNKEPQTISLHKSGGLDRVAVGPDGKTVAVGSTAKTVKILDIQSGAEIRSLQVEQPIVTYLTFSPDGKFLATVTIPDPKAIMNASTANLAALSRTAVEVWNISSGDRKLVPMEGLTQPVGSGQMVVFGPNNRTLVVGGIGSEGFKVRILDLKTGNVLHTLASGMLTDMAISPDGKVLATVGFRVVNNNVSEGELTLWDVGTGSAVQKFKVGLEMFGRMAFSADSKTLATAIGDKIQLWDIVKRAELRTLSGHSDSVLSVAFSPNGKLLLSGSRDRTAKVWDAANGTELATLITVNQRDWIVVTPDGQFDGSPNALSRILWRFSPDLFDVVPVESFFSDYYQPGLIPEIIAGKHFASPNGHKFATTDRRRPIVSMSLKGDDVSGANPLRERMVTIKVDVQEDTSKSKIAGHPAGSGVRDVRLFRNGSLVKVWRGDVLKKSGSATLEAVIPIVSGENRLTAYAFNHNNIKSSDVTLTLTGAEGLRRRGVVYVFAVGLNEYANPRYNLKYAVADAQDFAEEVKRQQAKLNNYERVEMITLNNRDATKSNILKSLIDLSGKVQPEDALVIYFAGHGTAQQNRFYLIPHDLGYGGSRIQLKSAGLDRILAHSISDEELQRAFEDIDAGQIVLVIDACNSGQVLESEDKRRGPMNSKGLAQLAYEKGMYILTAAQSYQAAREASRLGHGFLTYALVEEGLKTNAADRDPRDGQVLLREWLDFATERVPEMQQQESERRQTQRRRLERIKSAETDSGNQRSLQHPRVFYRREAELYPMIIARQ